MNADFMWDVLMFTILLGTGFVIGYMAGGIAAMDRAAKQRDELRRAQRGQD